MTDTDEYQRWCDPGSVCDVFPREPSMLRLRKAMIRDSSGKLNFVTSVKQISVDMTARSPFR
jgi:hypothetical protein